MPLNSIRSPLSWLVMACFAAAAFAEKPYNWKDNPPPLEVFASVLERAWAAAGEQDPFQSIKGGATFDRPGWSAKTVLPGFKESECWIPKNASTSLTYACVVLLRNQQDAVKVGKNIGKLVEGSRKDWIITALTPTKPSLSSAVFSLKGEFGEGNALPKPGSLSRNLMIVVSPNSVTLQVSGRWHEGNLDSLFATTISSGRYTKLPVPETSSDQAKATGQVAVSVVNNTLFGIDVWLSGPVDVGYRISARAAQNIAVDPGTYKIHGKFLATKGSRKNNFTD